MKEVDGRADNPMIAGSFNGWETHRMMSLQEACLVIDQHQTILPPEALKKAEYKRSKREIKIIEEYQQKVDTKYRKFWSSVFEDNLMYTPIYENYPYEYSVNEDTFVYFGYFKPMRHDYVVLENSGDEKQLFHKQ